MRFRRTKCTEWHLIFEENVKHYVCLELLDLPHMI